VTRIAVVTAEGARELDARTIAALPDSYTLLRRAATAAVAWLDARDERSAAVFVGVGNNGGDGWLIAGMLRQLGWNVTVHAAGEPKTADAARAKADAEGGGVFTPPTGTEALILDALLGTGARGEPRDVIAAAIHDMLMLRRADTVSIAIDLPSALDATTGEDGGALPVDHTLTFGSIKRGQLLRRDLTGALHVLDIGLVDAPDAPSIVDARSVLEWLPGIAPDAWKGTRGRLAIVGGGAGMAGAVILASRGAHASGIGMVRADVSTEAALALQVATPFATVHTWHTDDWRTIDARWPDAMVIGPGLDGTDAALRERVLQLLHNFRGPVVLDAGALTAFHHIARPDAENTEDANDGHYEALRHALRGREALLTPHVGEFRGLVAARPSSRASTVTGVSRFDDPQVLARALNATILLKGVPTVIASPTGVTHVSATGNPALAMGGTGDLLSGIAGAMLAQGLSALHAGGIAAWVHGCAAEQAVARRGGWRGVTMELLIQEVSNVWPRLVTHSSPSPHAVLDLPAVPRT
jgi:ADP-dependent NAD(P)H-hydrate dehydratase / NAD(P)H-hydrate epimerase